MPIHTLTRKDGSPFPTDTSLRIESVAEPGRVFGKNKRQSYKVRNVFFTGKVDDEVVMNFPIGKYTYKAHLNTEDQMEDFNEYGEFLVGCTEEQWRKIQRGRPRECRPIMVLNATRWDCDWPGCRVKTKTRLAAYLHEMKEHFHIDVLASDGNMKEKIAQGAEAARERAQAKDLQGQERRGPGGPRKDQ